MKAIAGGLLALGLATLVLTALVGGLLVARGVWAIATAVLGASVQED